MRANDYGLIKRLPKRLAAEQTRGHKGWDSGVTGEMVMATYRYNDALIAMIKDLAKTYYPKAFVTDRQIDAYLKALYTVHRLKQNVANPSGESQGSETHVDVPAGVTVDLENTISDMVAMGCSI